MEEIFTRDELLLMPPEGVAKAKWLAEAWADRSLVSKHAGDLRFEGEREGFRKQSQLRQQIEVRASSRHHDKEADERDRKRIQSISEDITALRARSQRAMQDREAFAIVFTLKEWLQAYSRRHAGSHVDRFARRNGGGPPLFKHKASSEKIKGDPREALAARRADILNYAAAWEEVVRAPVPRSDLLAGTVAAVDQIAAIGRPLLNRRAREGDPFALLPTFRGDEKRTSKDGTALLFWLFRDTIVDRLTVEIGETDDARAMSDEAREAAFAELAAKKLEAERKEEAAICACEAQGILIARRRDADPRAVLELAE